MSNAPNKIILIIVQVQT